MPQAKQRQIDVLPYPRLLSCRKAAAGKANSTSRRSFDGAAQNQEKSDASCR